MVIISVAICNKSGKALVARQFRDISRIRIEGLLSAFPKLMDPNSEHTFVETDSVRYVYSPVDALFLILITTKSSNIVEDLDTLQILSRVVKDTCSTVTEEEVINQAFELIMAFDELISMGYREKLELDQLHTILEMESHEENLQNLIRQSKIEDAKARAKNKAAEIAVEKAKNQGRYTKGIGSADALGRGSDLNFGRSSFSSVSTSSGGIGPDITSKYTGISSASASAYKPSVPSASSTSKPGVKPASMKLMPLSKGQAKKNDLLEEMAKSGEEISFEETENENINTAAAVIQPALSTIPAVERKGIHVQIEEKFKAEVNHEGGANIDLKGEMFLNIDDEANGAIRVRVNNERDSKGYTIKTHPKIDKKLYTDYNMIGLKSTKRPFPAGNLKVLTWRLQEEDESYLPFTVSCWPSSRAEGLSVSVEYELVRKDMELNNVVIAIPIPGADVTVETIEHGHYKIDAKNNLFLWYLDNVDNQIGNTSGNMEFLVAAKGDESSCFPVNVQFSSKHTLLGLGVDDVVSAADNNPVADRKSVV